MENKKITEVIQLPIESPSMLLDEMGQDLNFEHDFYFLGEEKERASAA